MVLHHPRVPLTADVVAAGDRLRAVFAPGAGYDGIPISTATEVGVLVTNQAGCNAEAVAEHSIGLLLAVAKRIAEGDRQIRSPRGWRTAMFLNHEIRGLTMGLVGFGAIARRLADIARQGFGMPVLAFDPYVVGAVDGVELCGLDDLLRRSDVVSVHVPLTDETRGLLGAPAARLAAADGHPAEHREGPHRRPRRAHRSRWPGVSWPAPASMCSTTMSWRTTTRCSRCPTSS